MPGPPARSARLLRKSSPLFVLAVAAICLALVAVIVLALRPGVPRKVVMATGFKGSAYQQFALDYRAILARHGVTLELRETRGAPQNLKALDDPSSGVQVGFLQSGILNGGRTFTAGLRESIGVEHPDLDELASVFYEPLWIFHRLPGDPVVLSELAGKRIAIGGPDTGTQVLLRQLLPVGGLELTAFDAREKGGKDAVAALAAGQLDVVMLVGAENSPLLAQLAAVPGVKLMSLAHAEALTRRFPWLAKLTLPRGGLDLARDLPPHDVTLVSSTAALVARRDLHPAIVLMLLEAAVETHSDPGTFQRQKEFPSVEHLELPIQRDAEKYIVEGPSFLLEHLPFSVATLVRRLSFILPAAALLFSILKYAPKGYAWWMDRRIYRVYGQLRTIEDELDRAGPDCDVAPWIARLARVDAHVARLATPLGYSDRLYTLRQHADFVRDRIERHRVVAEAPEAAPRS
jgi:TRAP-type uncharacterized transport system substrate-binding protein